ncbi:DoxX family protein [Candidatus Uabimicrobium sp. HlEnr_7]|uniref:DoxX family protein n=1 Tax=Candidatus Uabimicrobium helgolandensis TaxID=3095367 RepID=UPI003558DAF7
MWVYLKNQKTDVSVLILRLGIGSIFIIFGFDKLVRPNNWLIFLSKEISQYLTIANLTYQQFLWIQGVVEFMVGVHLILGLLTRTSAVIGSSILISIVFFLGFTDPTALRDIGILSGLLAIISFGSGSIAIDFWLKNGENT